MPHLELERLAAFDHERFSEEERAHLADCAICRQELDAMSRLVSQASMLTRDGAEHQPPLTSFEAIAGQLRPVQHRAPVAHPAWWSAAPRLAAAVVLVAAGALIGRLTDGRMSPDGSAAAARTVAAADDAPLTITTATALLDRAQRDYERAALWLAANDSVPQSSEVYRARLAALDEMMSASRAALREAPQDPLLNHYFLSAWAAREATLQQLGAALPVDKQVERY